MEFQTVTGLVEEFNKINNENPPLYVLWLGPIPVLSVIHPRHVEVSYAKLSVIFYMQNESTGFPHLTMHTRPYYTCMALL